MNPDRDDELHRLHVHHVGGRDGEVGGFPLNATFRDDVHLHIYEGDASCIPQIEEVNRARGHRFTVYDCLVADGRRAVDLHLTRDPCGSSLRVPLVLHDGTYIKHHVFGDYVLDDAFRPQRKLSASATTIDAIANEHRVSVDVLSIDTQGTEDLVLAGAASQLRAHTVAAVVEVAFREVYRGQPLFGDICRRMAAHGFEFIRFRGDRRDETSRFRGPLGWRGRAGTLFEDALFFRAPEHILAEAEDPTRALLKLAYVATCHDHLELALACLRHASPRDDFATIAAERQYGRFLAELLRLYDGEEHVWMATFGQLFDEQESLARFEEDILHHWNIYSTDAARKRYFASTDRAVFCRRIEALLSDAASPLEQLLSTHGFAHQAAEIAARRRSDAERLARMLHGLHHRDPVDALDLSELRDTTMKPHVCPVRRRPRA